VSGKKRFEVIFDKIFMPLGSFQGRGLSLASLKHLKFLKRFLNKRTSAYIEMQRSVFFFHHFFIPSSIEALVKVPVTKI